MTRLSFFLALLVALFCSTDSLAQTWEKKQDVNGNITYVGFNRFSPNSQVGYFGVMGSTYELWRTSDFGETWTKVNLTLTAPPVDMTFKDELTGWLTTGLAQTGTVYKTTDGGLTWAKQPLDHPGSGIVYVHATRFLFVSIWPDASGNSASFVSNDEGASWTPFNINGLNGYAFSDGQHGLASVLYDSYLRTSNGGQTWEKLLFNLEAWQPLAIRNTNTYFVASESNEALYRSDDHGSTWQLIHVFPADKMNLTGDLKGDLCAMLVQSESKTDPDLNGLLYSKDEGLTWIGLGGPPNFGDTRFDLVGKTIFAGESRDFADQLPRSLWKFQLPEDVGPTEAKLVVEYNDGSKTKTLTPDERSRVNVHLSDPIPAEMNVGSIEFDLIYDLSAATVTNLTAHQGWTVSQQQALSNGSRIELTKTPGSTIGIETLVSFDLKPYFGISENRDVRLENINFGGASQQPIKCFVINSIGDEISFDLNFNNCEDSLLFRLLDGRTPIEILSIRPNPADASNHVSIELFAITDNPAVVSLINAEGKIVKTESKQLLAGHSSLDLSTMGLSSGVYTLIVRSHGVSRSRNVVIR